MPLYSGIKNRVAFIGEIGVGKSYMAKWMEKNHGYKVFSFARGLKEIAVEYYEMKHAAKDRKLLQTLGDAMRSVDKNVFARKTVKHIAEYEAQGYPKRVVVDDLRFDNEKEALTNIRGSKFVIIRLKSRLVEEGYKDHKDHKDHKDEHISEEESRKMLVDYEINSGDFESLMDIIKIV
jgi:hypothetical protein